MRKSRWIMVALFTISAAVVVEAQQPGRGRGGFRGGFGFDLSTLVVSNKALQDELKVTDAQKEKFKGLAEKQAERRKKQFESFKNGDRKNFDKEKFAERRKESEAFNAQIKKAVDGILTPDQNKRLKQINLQRQGVRAFGSEETAKDLNLTDSQKSKVKGILEDYSKDSRELFGRGGRGGRGGFDREKAAEMQKKREKLSKAALADIEDTLTADQKSKWKELTGAPFDTSKLFQGFGGFGGRGNRNKGKTKD